MVIFLLEISAGISIYAYRDKLLDGLGKGLNQSLDIYKYDKEKANDFDLMQSTVSLRHVGTGIGVDYNTFLRALPIQGNGDRIDGLKKRPTQHHGTVKPVQYGA
jgi:hypothetical protein